MRQMDRECFIAYIENEYGIKPDNPWPKYPEDEVLRHPANNKWFALVMAVSRRHLGFDSDEVIDVVNVKCDPALGASYRREAGILPAYHMNKDKWLTLLLDGTVPDEMIKELVDISFNLTRPKIRAKKIKSENPD